MLHINTIPLVKENDKTTYWAKFELDNERITCRFIKDGETLHSVHNIKYPYGTVGMVVYLNNKANAEKEIAKIIDRANVSEDSELKGLSVYNRAYHK